MSTAPAAKDLVTWWRGRPGRWYLVSSHDTISQAKAAGEAKVDSRGGEFVVLNRGQSPPVARDRRAKGTH